MDNGFIPPHGHYQELLSYKKSAIVYSATVKFCERFISIKDRTYDQMVQAARSGKQNIIEGSEAAPTSSETEIKLLNVARASLKELQADYEDYLRARKIAMWDEQHPRYEGLRTFCRETNDSEAYMAQVEKMNDEEIANMAITMCHQVDVMMIKYIGVKEREFVENGGIREAMTRARLQYRNEHPTT